jgi:hypothetical protein
VGVAAVVCLENVGKKLSFIQQKFCFNGIDLSNKKYVLMGFIQQQLCFNGIYPTKKCFFQQKKVVL